MSAPAAARGFASKVKSWSGARKIGADELLSLCEQLAVPGPDDPSWDKSVHRLAAKPPGGPGAIEDDLLVRAMRELDLVLGQARDSAMGTGFDVRCPWEHEHTARGDTGAFYAPGRSFIGRGRGFRCHHGHCDGRGIPELLRRVDEMLREDSGGLVCLGALDFDEVDPASVPLVKGARRVRLDGKSYEMTEDGIALAFVDVHLDRVRFNHTRKEWVIWDSTRWFLDETERAFSLVRQLTRKLRGDVKALAKTGAARAIEVAARADQRIATVEHHWDQDPCTLAAAGVRVDLRDGLMRALVPRDMMVRSTLVAPDPAMATPIWDSFLWETFGGDTDQIEWLYQWFGYSLTGDVSAEMFVFMFGGGLNGKGTVIETISDLAGDYAKPIPTSLLMERKFDGHSTEIARLSGARMLYGSELNKEQHLDLARIKRLTSREGMEVARFTNRNDFEFKRTGKITITGNNKPVIGHVDLAIKRRLVLWHFMHEVPNPDGALKDKLTPEYPGILWKLIVGASEVLATIAAGGTLWDLVPQAVRQSSADYLVEEDAVARWLGERCDTGVSYRVGVTEAHADYDAWCCGEEHLPVSVRKFGGEVKRAAGVMGVPIEVRHTSAGNVLTGIKLKPNKL